MPNSKRSPIRTTPITKTQSNGSAISIQTASANASQTAVEKPPKGPMLRRLLIAAAFVVVNLLTDLTYAWVDPRIRYD